MSIATTAPATKKLTLADRCDQGNCNAAAAATVILVSGELLFCQHHLTANQNRLQQLGAVVR